MSSGPPNDEPDPEFDRFEALMQNLVPADEDDPIPAILICPRCEAAIPTRRAGSHREPVSLWVATTKGPPTPSATTPSRWIPIHIDAQIVHECGEHWPPVR
jgi:hypothetical protein